jgi:TonB family protein
VPWADVTLDNIITVNSSIYRACLFILASVVLAPARAAETPPVPPADAPWKVRQTTRAIYPPRLMQNGVTNGEARVRVSIDATGKLLDVLVVSSTHREFGEEALRVVKTWRYDPGREKGEPIGIVGDITFSFVVTGTIAVVKSAIKDTEVSEPVDSTGYGAESMKRIDRIPTPTHVVPPIYPKEWSDRGITGSATVEFFIDESGRARIPFVTSADQPLLGASAVAAVTQWRFEPPTRSGTPVLVRAQQVFTFEVPKK